MRLLRSHRQSVAASSTRWARGRGARWAVATEDARATQIGINVLKQEGNAVDAAVAAAAAPRISQRNGGSTQVDGGFEQNAIAESLTALGHVLEPVLEIEAAVGLMIRPDGSVLAAAEPTRRGGGTAMVMSR